MPFAVSATTRERAHRVDVDERQHVLDVVVEEVALLDRPGRGGRAVPWPAGQLAELVQPRVLADGPRAGQAELHARCSSAGCGWP